MPQHDTPIADATQRQRALDTQHSFIVQAPAGSGKTELLTQRMLALLAQAKQPEDILAITFTRKAAHEMQARLLRALHLAEGDAPHAAHALTTWQLARRVLAQDQQHAWQLRQNPQRLRVHTIDAFCASIAKQLPILSGFGAYPDILEDATPLYQQTARDCLSELDSTQAFAPALANLLSHLDNRYQRAENLLADMLACRDQWLPYLGYRQQPEQLRAHLEAGLAQLATDQLTQLQPLIAPYLATLTELVAFAQHNQPDTTHPALTHWTFTAEHLSAWRTLAQRLLTTEGQWRSRVQQQHGFPAPSSSRDKQQKALRQQMKQRMHDLLAQLADADALRQCLQQIVQLPDRHYTTQQWELVSALIELLPVLAAQLLVNFQQRGAVDYVEVTQRALLALGDEEQPTDLALLLDYRIQHILMDEFQDTSSTQFRLLQRLTTGWQPEDGRTLFLVGDPMQSIYRFRKAEVGLFLQARVYGIGAVALENLTLSSNFRAHAGLITWLNTTFTALFPTQCDMTSGAIDYSNAQAVIPARSQAAVIVHAHQQTADEAHTTVAIIQDIQQHTPTASIAILVKARAHLAHIVPALQQANIAYHANEIEKLSDKPIIDDLLSLTQALLHRGNRLAWLSLLRAPWCGLTLADLHALTYQQPSITLWQCLLQHATLPLSVDGQQRCQRIVAVLADSLRARKRHTLRGYIEGAWIALGGPACVTQQESLQQAQAFFAVLDENAEGNDIADWAALTTRLTQVTISAPKPADAHVEIMTIHKAKGLEFDYVILPHLGASTRHAQSQLLLWREYTGQQQRYLLLAPIRHTQVSHDPIYRYLQRIEQSHEQLEQTRLLYVAATRARQQLHLLGSANYLTEADGTPRVKVHNASFLHQLWPCIATEFTAQLHAQPTPSIAAAPLTPRLTLARLPSTWTLPPTWHYHGLPSTTDTPTLTRYDMTPPTTHPAHIGSVAHKLLQRISVQGVATWSRARIDAQYPWIKTQLLSLGTRPQTVATATHCIMRAIEQTLDDPRGRWILAQHPNAASEYPLTAYIEGECQHFVIDRTFIDEQQRWIIDYKISLDDTSLPDTLTRKIANYRQQLETYAKAFRLIEQRVIQLGLYFPLQQQWYTWQYLG